MAARVSGRGDQQEILVNMHRRGSGDDPFDASRGGTFAFVQHARTVEVRCKFGVIRDVIAVRQQHEIDAAHFFHALHKWSVEARRIDKDVAALLGRTHDQIGPCTEARLRGEAAKINIVHDVNGKRGDPGSCIEVGNGPNRRSGARNERHERAVQFAGVSRLVKNARFSALIAEAGGRNLSAGVAVDATFVDVKFAGNILRKALVNLSHKVVS